MTRKYMAAAAIAALLMVSPGRSQSAADLLQRGIYAQETAGDLDGAIQLFRQAINAASASRPYAAQAIYHLGSAQAAKGDFAAAAQTFRQLVDQYSEQRELAARLQQYLPAYKPPATQPGATATIHHESATGVSFVIPPGWMVSEAPFSNSKSPEPPTLVHLSAPDGSNVLSMIVRSGKTDLSRLEQVIASQPDVKEAQMRQDGNKEFTVRRETVHNIQVGGARGLKLLADYAGHGQKLELLTWLWGANTQVMIYYNDIDAGRLAEIQPVFDSIVNTLIVP